MRKSLLCIAAIFSVFALGLMSAQMALAEGEDINYNTQTGGQSATTGGGSSQSICDEYNNAADRDLWIAAGCGNSTTADTFANNVIAVVLSLVGLVAIGVMVFGGIMYTISTGDAAKVQRAKHIIMYGIIGLAVVLLAYAIVRFVGQAVSTI